MNNNENIPDNYATERKSLQINNKIKTNSTVNNPLQSKTRSDIEKSKSVSLLKTANNSKSVQKTNNTKVINPVKKMKVESEEEENIFALGKTDDDLLNEYNQLKSLMNSKNNKAKTNVNPPESYDLEGNNNRKKLKGKI